MAVRALIFGMVVSLALAGLCPPALCQTAPAADRLSLVTGEDYPPFADPGLPGGGIATVLVRRAFEQTGAEVAVDFLPWRRGYEESLRHRYHGTFPYVHTAERERDFLYSDAMITMRQVLFVPARRPVNYRTLADLRGLRVCAALGYALPAAVQRMIDREEVSRVTPGSAAMCPNLVAAERADFFIQDERIGTALVARVGMAGTVVAQTEPAFGVSDLHLIGPRSRPDAAALIGRFNDGLRRLRASGGYERLLVE